MASKWARLKRRCLLGIKRPRRRHNNPIPHTWKSGRRRQGFNSLHKKASGTWDAQCACSRDYESMFTSDGRRITYFCCVVVVWKICCAMLGLESGGMQHASMKIRSQQPNNTREPLGLCLGLWVCFCCCSAWRLAAFMYAPFRYLSGCWFSVIFFLFSGIGIGFAILDDSIKESNWFAICYSFWNWFFRV